MGKIQIIGQKIQGEAEQLKGRIEDATGQHVKGTIDQLRGKANVIEADVKMKIEELKDK
jgi:uncharacterized protein YjbJ (UPF0337 family)